LEGVPYFASRGHVRAAAEVEPLALLVDLDLLVVRDGVDELDLEQLTLVAEHALGRLARPNFFGEGFVARDDLAHLLLDGAEILRGERLVAEKVVVKAVLDHRADGDLGPGPKRLHGFGEHVRGVVPDELQRARILAGEELDLRIALDGVAQIREHAVERHGDRALGERGRSPLGDVDAGGAFGVRPTRAVGKGQRDHHSLLLLTRCLRMQVSVAGLSWMASDLPSLPRARTCGKATPKLIRCDLYDVHAPRNAVRRLERLNERDEHARKRSAARRRRVDGAIGAAPATVAPGQVPARMIGQ